MKDIETFDDYLDDIMEDYIALNFKGKNYIPTIRFVEVLSKRLKKQSKQSNDQIIKDILGR